ncbi:hypothetical protein QJS10_CPA09g00006 [Acorus calamus]|uniref:Uncharacterized protein n=1 Tax=Acorus calamus TaxID=4465 RepID=A0AAV9E6P2_ACOCL|nr:hypothetical protein QJS10_CPA09g00006 [Acorus calamus]
MDIQQQETKLPIWDSESTLDDAFKLNSFKRALDSTVITLRTQSMPNMPSEVPVPPSQKASPKQQCRLRRTSKLSQSLNRLWRRKEEESVGASSELDGERAVHSGSLGKRWSQQ